MSSPILGVYGQETLFQMKRDLYWDSLKFVLIFFVVYGHTIESYAPNGSVNRATYTFLYVFHMPLFIFISGRFSQIKNKRKYISGILRILETYILFQVIWGLIIWSVSKSSFSFVSLLMWPNWTLWYLLSLVYWRLMVAMIPRKIIDDRPLSILVACFFISILGGLIPVGAQFSLQRTMAFMPFFFMGYYSTKIDIMKYINKIPLKVAIIFIVFVYILIYFKLNFNITYITNSTTPYISISSMSSFLCCFARGGLLVLAIILSMMVMRIVRSQSYISNWGAKTLVIYMFHSFAIKVINVFISRGYIPQNEVLLFVYAVIITLILAFLSQFKLFYVLLNPIGHFFHK